MRIAVTGSSGFVGSALVPALRVAGHEVVRLVRRPTAGPDEITWDPAAGTIDRFALEGLDGVVHLAGAGVGERRWTDERKQVILESRVRGTALLVAALGSLASRPATLVSASGVNWYGFDRGDEILTEHSGTGDGFLAEVCRQWEAATEPAADAGIRVVTLRTGIVLGEQGGALGRQLPLFKLGLGGRLGSGRTWWSWIALEDHVALILHVLRTEAVSGPLNATAPVPVRNAELTKALGRALSRPTPLRVPRFGPALLFGRQMNEEMVFSSLRVLPEKALASGFEFRHPEIDGALRSMLDSDGG